MGAPTSDSDRWDLVSGPTAVAMAGPGWTSFQFELARGDERRWMVVSTTNSARAVRLGDPELQRAVDTDGRSIVEMAAWMDPPPREVRVNSERCRPPLEHLRDSAQRG